MGTCSVCGTTILFGGTKELGLHFCSTKCYQRGTLVRTAAVLDEDDVIARAEEIQAGPCPKCQGDGPVEVFQTHTAYSALVVTWWRSRPVFGCLRCGRRAQLGALGATALFGWWGFPFGLIATPIQIARNITALTTRPIPGAPSQPLVDYARLDLAARAHAAPPTQPPPADEDTPAAPAPQPARDEREPVLEEPMFGMESPPRERRKRRKAPILVALALVTLLGIYIATTVAVGKNRVIWLVNGIGTEYIVHINGDRYVMPPHGARHVELGEGDFTIECVTPEIDLEDQTVTIETPFLSRLVERPMFIINPDRAAVLIWEQAEYTEHGVAAKGTDPPRIELGQLLTRFDSVEYRFKPMPDVLEIDSSRTLRESVDSLILGREPIEVADIIAYERDLDTAVEWLERRLHLVPSSRDDIFALATLIEPELFMAKAETHLATRPIAVDWHRMYQDAAQMIDSPGLVDRYRAYVDAESDVPELWYLLGRILDDPIEAESLARRAADADVPHAYATIAADRLGVGDFDAAIEAIDAAREADGTLFTDLRDEIYHAAGRFEMLAQHAAWFRTGAPIDTGTVAREVYYLARQDLADQAQQTINNHLNALRREGVDPHEIELSMAILAIEVATATDDRDTFVGLALEYEELDFVSDAAMLTGDYDGALEAAYPAGTTGMVERLLIASLALLDGETELATLVYEEAIEMAASDANPNWRRVGDWLDSSPPDELQVRALELMPGEKRVALAALGAAFPEERERLWTLAERLNYDRHWPYFGVREILRSR